MNELYEKLNKFIDLIDIIKITFIFYFPKKNTHNCQGMDVFFLYCWIVTPIWYLHAVIHASLHVSLVLWIKMGATLASHILVTCFCPSFANLKNLIIRKYGWFMVRKKVEEVLILIWNIYKMIRNWGFQLTWFDSEL